MQLHDLGGIPPLLQWRDMSNTLPNEKVRTYVLYINACILSLQALFSVTTCNCLATRSIIFGFFFFSHAGCHCICFIPVPSNVCSEEGDQSSVVHPARMVAV